MTPIINFQKLLSARGDDWGKFTVVKLETTTTRRCSVGIQPTSTTMNNDGD
jgi:hypothetical protein